MILGLKKYQYHIVTTFAFIVLADYLNVWIQLIIALILIFSLGLIHGANDLQLIRKKTQNHSQMFFLKTLLCYVLVVLVGIGLFFFLPGFGLFFFIVFSAFHFGEQHLESKLAIQSSDSQKTILYVAYGCSLFGLLFTLQWNEVHQVIYQISGYFISKEITELMFFLGLLVFLVLGWTFSELRKWLFFEVLLLLFIGLLFSRVSLILGFGLYFVIWHSVPSMQDQLAFLYPQDAKSRLKYLRSSAPYWLLSIIGLLGVYFFFDIRSVAFLPLFFSFLAAITFPHTVVMGWLKLSEQKMHSSGVKDHQSP